MGTSKTVEPHVEEAQPSPLRRDYGLYNDQVRRFRWNNISATVPGDHGAASSLLLQRVSGSANGGEFRRLEPGAKLLIRSR